MVSNTSWDDKKIEDLLRGMPKVEDHRSQNEIYYQIQKRMRKEKRNYWFIPAAAVAAVLLLSLLLYPSIFSNDQALNESVRDVNQDQGATDNNVAGNLEAESDQNNLTAKSFDEGTIGEDQGETGIGMLVHTPKKTALYEGQLPEQSTTFTYAVPDDQAQNVVPVTIAVPENSESSWADQYNRYLTEVPFEEIGLDGEYLPYKGEVTVANDTTIQLNLDEGHPYSAGSASNVNLLSSLEYSLAYSPYDKVILMTNGTLGMDFGNFGEMKEHNVAKNLKHPFFIYKKNEESKALLVPYIDTLYSSIEDALLAMEEDIDTHSLQGPLKNVDIERVSVTDTELTVEFNDQLLPDTNESMLTLEAILLTAKNYGYETVIFKHPTQRGFADILFNEPVAVPLAPNYLEEYSKFER